ncbi:hypothetical protein F2P81_005562 [Scophthalmus maximus]|uniref:Uncharacterized protein n=1 Tax=Scophthalmus maximus TaxID=52904 RepID=A0A6A4TDY1_SCOMX|nr:hypothetical protein F2P81_005562 [Scophthalmus maximus]
MEIRNVCVILWTEILRKSSGTCPDFSACLEAALVPFSAHKLDRELSDSQTRPTPQDRVLSPSLFVLYGGYCAPTHSTNIFTRRTEHSGTQINLQWLTTGPVEIAFNTVMKWNGDVCNTWCDDVLTVVKGESSSTCFDADFTSVQSSVSIPIPDRSTGRAQPVIQLLGPRSQCAAPRGAGESCGSEQRPSLSITFNICLSGTFNLFYSTTPLDSTDLPDPSERRTQTRLWEKEIADNIDMEKFHRKYGEKGFEVCRGIHMDSLKDGHEISCGKEEENTFPTSNTFLSEACAPTEADHGSLVTTPCPCFCSPRNRLHRCDMLMTGPNTVKEAEEMQNQ